MSDFISREALLDDIRKTITEKLDTMDWLNMISRQPTAYDVDKVVEQLENKIFSAEVYNDDFNGVQIDNLLCMGDVYEIVKAGGVDE